MSAMEAQPMKASELGQYVCVAHGGCLHTERGGRTIRADGVWVRSPDPDPLNPGSHVYSSAHRDCYEAWAGTTNDWRRGIAAGEVVIEGTLHGDREILVATQPGQRGNYEGYIIHGASSDRPRELFSFNITTARATRAATPDDYNQAGQTPCTECGGGYWQEYIGPPPHSSYIPHAGECEKAP
jgi:hypothetical protein